MLSCLKFVGYMLFIVLLRVIPLIWKCAVWVTQTWSISKVVEEPVQSVTVETEFPNTMEDETQNVEESEEVQPLDKHEEQHDYSNDNENNGDLTPLFAQNAIQFSTPANNLSLN